MRILNSLSGLAVLFTTPAFRHLLHHQFLNPGEALHSPLFLAGMIICVAFKKWWCGRCPKASVVKRTASPLKLFKIRIPTTSLLA